MTILGKEIKGRISAPLLPKKVEVIVTRPLFVFVPKSTSLDFVNLILQWRSKVLGPFL